MSFIDSVSRQSENPLVSHRNDRAADLNPLSLRVTEIYASIQGESSYAGLPCVFIRLTGCPLRCKWCDTAYSFEGGKDQSFKDILAGVEATGIDLVELTGGEPLAQKSSIRLMDELVRNGKQVLLETSGSEPLVDVPKAVHIIMDLKCPASGMSDKNLWENLADLKPSDEIKFVLANRADFDWALARIQEHQLDERFNILFSPAFGHVKPADLAAWMIAERVTGRLNLQQHKYIWHPRAKGV